MKTIKLPEAFSPAEMSFIEEWYSEEGMQQLLSSNGRRFAPVDKPSPKQGALYVSVKDIPVPYIHRDNKTLQRIAMTELRTVELLVSEDWIK